MTNIAIASDHGGLALKSYIVSYLQANDISCQDFGCFREESVDYPDFAKLVTEAVSQDLQCFGILICKSGIGMSIAANRNPKIRAALCFNPEMARLARLHNDANVIIFGANYISEKEALECVEMFLNTEFEGGRHQKRVDKLS